MGRNFVTCFPVAHNTPKILSYALHNYVTSHLPFGFAKTQPPAHAS